MITLRLNAYPPEELTELISRLESIDPANDTRCQAMDCTDCDRKHICYDVQRAIEYAKGYLDGGAKR